MGAAARVQIDARGKRTGDARHRGRHAGAAHHHLVVVQHVVLAGDHDAPAVVVDRRAGQFHQRRRRRMRIDAVVGDAQGVDAGRCLDVDGLHFGH